MGPLDWWCDQGFGVVGIAFGVLGPVWAEDERGRLPLKGPRHRAVLARLLVARGRVVPVAQLVDDLWERPPKDAVGAIQTFVAALRRVLEPARKPRERARVLVTDAPGYALRVGTDQVDGWRFEAAVGRVDDLLSAGRAADALHVVESALGWWQGPAYAEFADEGWARAEVNRLDERRSLAIEQRARALMELGRHADAVPALEAHLGNHPMREPAWQLLALAQYRSGRQGDALAAIRRVRRNLREVGIDPGPGLRGLEADILSQAPRLLLGARSAGITGASAALAESDSVSVDLTRTRPRSAGVDGVSTVGAQHKATWTSGTPAKSTARLFIGRVNELVRLRRAADECVAGGRSRLVLISGVEGTGKSALAEAFSVMVAEQGWTTAWGPSPADRGTPASWPWTRILAGLVAAGCAPGPAAASVDGAGDIAVARFRAHLAAAEYLAGVARHRPVLLVFDDLHQAAEETLDLLSALVTVPIEGPVLLVATYRATDVDAVLTAILARMARAEPIRVYLSGLAENETVDLVRELVGDRIAAAVARRIHRRSNGNPFFAREIARLLGDEGVAALEAVPAGVRDVVRQRLSRLSRPERTVLQQAAVIGTDIDRDLLVELVGDEELALDAVDAALRAGFLTESGPSRMSFAHGVVHDVLYQDIAGPRRATWHSSVGELLEKIDDTAPAVLAYHFVRADSRATAGRAAHYARAAALDAERVFAPHEAARRWREAVIANDRAAENDVRAQLEATMGLVRALAVTGNLGAARIQRAQAIATAEELADPALTARVISAFDVPALWTDNDDPDLAERVVRATERTLAALPSDDLEVRSRLLTTLALELRATGGVRGRSAAAEAEAIARQLDNPALLAFALNGRFMQTFERTGLAPERGRIAAELIDLAAEHNLVTFEVLGHLVGIQSCCAAGDFVAADGHAAAVALLADTYDLPLVPVFIHWYSALRRSISGTYEEAEAAYRAAAAELRGTAMPGLEHGILALALFCLSLQHGCRPIITAGTDFGAHELWVRPLILLDQNRPDDARRALRSAPDSPHDLLLELRLCLIARAALALDDRPTLQRVYAQLRPAATELAGAGTGLLTLEPVAYYLGQLATALGDPTAAATHRRQAFHLAQRVDAPRWIAGGR